MLVENFDDLQKFAHTLGYSVEIDPQTQQIYVVGDQNALTFDAYDIENVLQFLQENNDD